MIKIECLCVDDQNKPKEIPNNLWVKKNNKYQVIHIFAMVNQKGIKGCEIAEIDLGGLKPYNCFRLDRFAFTEEGLKQLTEMMKHCTELNNIEISKIIEKIVVKEELI